jgi:hypothetical protein
MTNLRALAALTVVAAAAVVYHPAVPAYFFDDDFQWLVSTFSFRLAGLVDFASMTHFYRPLIQLYFAIATPLFAGSPTLFHVASIALHALNGLLVLAFAQRMSRSLTWGFLSALFFVVQPADIDAIAWVGALGEPLSLFFGLIALLAFLRFQRTPDRRWQVLSVTAFLLALLTHESSVMFLPLLVLTAYAVSDADPRAWRAERWRELARPFVPYALVAGAYLAIDLWINSRSYLISEGHYSIGPHAIANTLDYIVALYVGRRDAVNYVAVAVAVPLLLLRGSARVRLATCWIVLGLAPFVFFTWGNESRYLYLPAVGFAMLLAEGVTFIARVVGANVDGRLRPAATMLLGAALAIRFVVFAIDNVHDFAARTETYRQYGQRFREVHGPLSRYSRVRPDSRLRIDHEPRFVAAMIQWEYKDPTIELIVPDEPGR